MGTDKSRLQQQLEKYYSAVTEVQKGNLSTEERLKRLLEPVVELYDQSIWLRHGKRYNFAREDYVDLEEKLDLSSLKKTSDAWYIHPTLKMGQYNDLDTEDEIISAVNYKKFLPQSQHAEKQIREFETTSIEHLHKIWLPFLAEERIKSKDLLDQALVCYTIKRAQNGDQNAGDRLMALYLKRAQSEETFHNVMKMLTRSHIRTDDELNFDTLTSHEGPDVELDEDFRQTASFCLCLIIRGFTPKNILDVLTSGALST